MLIGIESSNLFGCSEQMGQPECSRRRHRSGDPRRPPPRRAQRLPDALDGQRLRRRRARGRRQGARSSTCSRRSRPGTTSAPARARSPGRARNMRHAEPGRARVAVELLPGGEAAGAGGHADLSGRDPVQRKGPDAARGVSDQAADGEPHADRDGSHERVGARDRAQDGDEAPLSARLQPHRHGRAVDSRTSCGCSTDSAAWPRPGRTRRPRWRRGSRS